jgi:hypothetical protein
MAESSRATKTGSTSGTNEEVHQMRGAGQEPEPKPKNQLVFSGVQIGHRQWHFPARTNQARHGHRHPQPLRQMSDTQTPFLWKQFCNLALLEDYEGERLNAFVCADEEEADCLAAHLNDLQRDLADANKEIETQKAEIEGVANSLRSQGFALAAANARIAELGKLLAKANKGAETNAEVCKIQAGKNWELRDQLKAANARTIRAVEIAEELGQHDPSCRCEYADDLRAELAKIREEAQ